MLIQLWDTTIHIYMWKHNNDERTRFFRKIYLSHFIRNGCERVMCERWIGDWTKTETYWPPILLSLPAFLSRSARLLNRRPWGSSSLLSLVLTASNCNNWLRLTELPVAPGYIIVWHSPASHERHICTEFNPPTVKTIPWYLRPDAPVPWSTAGLEVNMLQ